MKFLSDFIVFGLFLVSSPSFATDTLPANEVFLDNGDLGDRRTLVSASKKFEFGFYSPLGTANRYLGVWFRNIFPQVVVWVGNRNSPLLPYAGILTLSPTGRLILFNNTTGIVIWSLNSSTALSKNIILKLHDDGNLALEDSKNQSHSWQSFDHLCDTLLPGMIMGWNLVTGQEWYLNSWKSLQDPSIGDYTYMYKSNGLAYSIMRQGSTIVYRAGSEDPLQIGSSFSALQQRAKIKPVSVVNSTIHFFAFENMEKDMISRLVLNPSGVLQLFVWKPNRNQWVLLYSVQRDKCNAYGRCGPNGFCVENNGDNTLCVCPTGFKPKAPLDWEGLDWSSGCVRKAPLNCTSGDRFLKFSKLKLPDNSLILPNPIKTKIDLLQCRVACLRNCSCIAYTFSSTDGCVVWHGDLIDMVVYLEDGADLYIRVTASFSESTEARKPMTMILSVSLSSGIVVLAVAMGILWKLRVLTNRRTKATKFEESHADADDEEFDQLLLYDLETIVSATDNFSSENKIGAGGFGTVYKGELPSGQKIAVKRLSKDSGEGMKEFKKEVIFISNLQHRNLVRLLGCCMEEDDRMLVLEYMPNRSLDLLLFAQTKETSLGWTTRFNIITGIARGLLHLHQDSRLKIIHRDLKASNILLDDDMNPKISDFGSAKALQYDRSGSNTKRIMGTYGYMPPEYAIEGLFSVKSDVYSFGVLTLEIVSGQKNRLFDHPDHNLNLLGHAWKLWIEGQAIELADVLMAEPPDTEELCRCIHVGLLCVQKQPECRPPMASVLFMLDSQSPILAQPKQPGFFTERCITNGFLSSQERLSSTANEVTVTGMEAR